MIVSVSCPVEPLAAPEIVATVSVPTATVVIVNVPDVVPAAIEKFVGRVAAGVLVVRVTG